MRDINFIVLHCSDSPPDRGDTAETIHSWHLDRGWDGIGYHYVILEDGTLEVGRPEYWIGSHVYGFNNNSIGICLIGTGVYSNRQICTMFYKLSELTDKYPDAKICEHCYLDSKKECAKFNDEIKKCLSLLFSNKFITANG